MMLKDLDVTYTLLATGKLNNQFLRCRFLGLEEFNKFSETLAKSSEHEIISFEIRGFLTKEGD